MATEVSIRELKAKLSEILNRVEETGEEIVVTRRGKPCGRLMPYRERRELPSKPKTLRGILKGQYREATWEDFMEAKKIWEPKPFPEDRDDQS